MAFRIARWPVIRMAQRRLLGYPAPCDEQPHALGRRDDPRRHARPDRGRDPRRSYGGRWRCDHYYVALEHDHASPAVPSADCGRDV